MFEIHWRQGMRPLRTASDLRIGCKTLGKVVSTSRSFFSSCRDGMDVSAGSTISTTESTVITSIINFGCISMMKVQHVLQYKKQVIAWRCIVEMEQNSSWFLPCLARYIFEYHLYNVHYIHISSLVHNTNSKPYFGNPNYTTSKQLICVLRCPQVFSELWQNQLGRVGLHSRVSEGWLSVFQGWVALRRMDPIVGCWVHPTSTRLFTRCPDADSTQHGTTGESLSGGKSFYPKDNS